jgi:hypothetical protein
MSLGVLKLPLTKRQYFTVTGGPFNDCPDTMTGVKMAAEIKKPCAIDIPTVDFQTPDRLTLYRGLHKALDAVLAGQPVYVGCMGGKGRTGLFLAVLAKAFGIKKPVEFVRQHYYAHAVETAEQYAFVKRFTITAPMRRKVTQARRRAWWRFWKTNLTRLPPPVGTRPAASEPALVKLVKILYPDHKFV